MALGREALGGKRAFKTKQIRIAEWDGEIIVRGLSTAEYEIVQDAASKGVDTTSKAVTSSKAMSLMARATVAFGWIDDEGNNVLSWPQDGPTLAKEPQSIIRQISEAVLGLTGVGGDDTDPIDAAEKN